MAQIGEWTLTAQPVWSSADHRLCYFFDSQWPTEAGWLVKAHSHAADTDVDNAALAEAGLLREVTGLSLRELVTVAAEVTGATSSIQRIVHEYVVEETPLLLCRVPNGWRFRYHMRKDVTARYCELVQERYSTRSQAMAALSAAHHCKK